MAGNALIDSELTKIFLELEAWGPKEQARFSKYFDVTTVFGYTPERHDKMIEGTRAPIRERLTSLARRLPFKEKVYFPRAFLSNEQRQEVGSNWVAAAFDDKVFINNNDFMALQPNQVASTLVHEHMHNIINQSIEDEHYRLLGEGVTGIPFDRAFKNVDSYVAYVLEGLSGIEVYSYR